MDIEAIRQKIERALSDGQLSCQESEDIKAAIRANGPITPEEIKLFRELQDKIWRGDIRLCN